MIHLTPAFLFFIHPSFAVDRAETEGILKRSLLLFGLTVLILAIPTTASASCKEICESAFRPCVYAEQTNSLCEFNNNVCWMYPCYAPGQTTMSAKYQVASVEIERIDPVDTGETEIRLASNETAPDLKSHQPPQK